MSRRGKEVDPHKKFEEEEIESTDCGYTPGPQEECDIRVFFIQGRAGDGRAYQPNDKTTKKQMIKNQKTNWKRPKTVRAMSVLAMLREVEKQRRKPGRRRHVGGLEKEQVRTSPGGVLEKTNKIQSQKSRLPIKE